MLRLARFPPDPAETRRWFETHPREWVEGAAYRFAVQRRETMIGVVDVDEIAGGWGHLGYWLDASSWGMGYASEAARAVVNFAFGPAGLEGLRSGHASDNPASGRVLSKLGFHHTDTIELVSRSRDQTIQQERYMMHRPPAV